MLTFTVNVSDLGQHIFLKLNLIMVPTYECLKKV